MVKRKAPAKYPMEPLDKSRDRLEEIEREAFLSFRGSYDDLERALGTLRLAPHLGWKPLVVIHSKATIAKFEQILGIEFRKEFKPEGPSARRSLGFDLVSKANNFWKAITGEEPVQDLDRKSRKAAV